MAHAHHHTHAHSHDGERYQQTKKITLLGAASNIFLSIVKCVVGWVGNSDALFADGIHSLSDLISDGIVLVAAKFASQGADEAHPYGHQRIETAATVAIAAFLLFAGLGIIANGAQHIFDPSRLPVPAYVFWIALLAFVINEAVFFVTLKVAKKIKSDMLKAQAWHRQSDAVTSFIVLIGVGASMLGFTRLDGIAAIVVGVFILKMAWQMGKASFDELIDKGLDDTHLEEIKVAIQQVEGVKALHQLRTRLMAGKVIADVHIIVDPLLSVSEGHYIGDKVYEVLSHDLNNIEDITVHVDSEDDETHHDAHELPSRKNILAKLESLRDQLPDFGECQLKNIHYSQHQFILELLFPIKILSFYSKEELSKIYLEKIKAAFPQSQVNIYFQ